MRSEDTKALWRKARRATLYKAMVILYSALVRRRFASCGRGVRIHPPAILNSPDRVVIGDGVSIGRYALLNCIEKPNGAVALWIGDGCSIGRFAHINAYERVVVEDHVLIAERVHISDSAHRFDDPDIPIMLQGETVPGPVVIRRGAWLGSGAVILPGVTVGRNAVVGANAVVNRDVPDNHIAVGVPARVRPKRAGGLVPSREDGIPMENEDRA